MVWWLPSSGAPVHSTVAGATFMIGRFDALRAGERALLVLHPLPSMTPERVVALAGASRRTVHVVAPPSWRRDYGIQDIAGLRSCWGRNRVTRWYEDGRTAIERALGSAAEHEVVGLLWPVSSATEAWQGARRAVRARASQGRSSGG